MVVKKYPVGTPIRYIGHCKKCKGKTGKIVEVRYDSEYCYINLPKSTCGDGLKVASAWNDLEPLVIKGQQLLFSFMGQENEI